MNKKLIQLAGAGGKAAGGSGPLTATDTLKSESYARVLDLISEGEVEGFVDQNGYLLQNAIISSQPTVDSAGRVNDDIVLAYGGRGYSAIDNHGTVRYSGILVLRISDPTSATLNPTALAGWTQPYFPSVLPPRYLKRLNGVTTIELPGSSLTDLQHVYTYVSVPERVPGTSGYRLS